MIAIEHFGRSSCWILDRLDIKDRSTAWTDVILSSCASIGLIHRGDLVVHVENEECVGLLVHKHDIILVPEQSILVESVRYSLESFREFLLGEIYQQLALILLIEVLLLVVAGHFVVLGPVADASAVCVLGAA